MGAKTAVGVWGDDFPRTAGAGALMRSEFKRQAERGAAGGAVELDHISHGFW